MAVAAHHANTDPAMRAAMASKMTKRPATFTSSGVKTYDLEIKRISSKDSHLDQGKPPIVALKKLLPPGSQDEESDSEGDEQAGDEELGVKEVEAGEDDDLLAERVDQERGHRHRQDGKKGGVSSEMGTELSFTHYFYSENEK